VSWDANARHAPPTTVIPAQAGIQGQGHHPLGSHGRAKTRPPSDVRSRYRVQLVPGSSPGDDGRCATCFPLRGNDGVLRFVSTSARKWLLARRFQPPRRKVIDGVPSGLILLLAPSHGRKSTRTTRWACGRGRFAAVPGPCGCCDGLRPRTVAHDHQPRAPRRLRLHIKYIEA
jgi:hypothetical protein